ncbi:MAG TPA: DUF5666 domain-containing protein [Acidimicrobiia bacterium]|nr:DUF5666 domain-containing protein [Acidimicrobiia bacterium]
MDAFDEPTGGPAPELRAPEVPVAPASVPATADDDFWGDRADPATPERRTGSTRRRRWRTWLVAGVGAAAIGGAAVAGIGAASSDSSLASAAAGSNGANPGNGPGGFNGAPPGAGNGQGAFGTISAIDGSAITVKDAGGRTTKVTTTASTTVTTTVTASVSAVKVGDRVVVSGSGSSSKIAATQVHDDGAASSTGGNGPAGGPGGGPGGTSGDGSFVSGTVAGVDGSTFTVTDTIGTTVTVTTSSSTTVTKDETVGVSDLAVGDYVMVSGSRSNGVLTATRIREGGGFAGGPGGLAPPRGSA